MARLFVGRCDRLIISCNATECTCRIPRHFRSVFIDITTKWVNKYLIYIRKTSILNKIKGRMKEHNKNKMREAKTFSFHHCLQ